MQVINTTDTSTALTFVVSRIAPLFSYMSEREYELVRRGDTEQSIHAAVATLTWDATERARWERSLILPSWSQRSLLQNELLVSGMPFAALPVESLYKPWSTSLGNDYGAQRGLYLGDSARHLQALYASLDLTVPVRFAAMPDHLSLLLELLSLFVGSGNERAARDVVADHLDWLDAYDATLAARSEALACAPTLATHRREALGEGITHLRALVYLANRSVQEVCR